MTDAQLAPAKATRLYVPELEGLRGILALWVFIYHALSISGVWNRIPPKAAEVLNGNQAVCVFIILSGFVITVLLATTRDD
jgi:peptidoglycan/LPS O-acetylase OafA/YrhL